MSFSSWDDAALYSGFDLVGRPVGSNMPVAVRGDGGFPVSVRGDDQGMVGRPIGSTMPVSVRGGDPGLGPVSAPQPGYSIVPISEQMWQQSGAPWAQDWSDRAMAANEAAATEIAAELGSQDTGSAIGGYVAGDDTSMGGTTAGTGSPGSGWDIQNQWNAAYDAASSTTGVPANFIKAVQGKETGKFWNGAQNYGTLCPNQPGGDVLNPGMGCVATNTGIYQTTAQSYGLDFDRISRDPQYAIYAMGVVLNGIAQAPASNFDGPNDGQTVLEYAGWEGVAGVYFGGSLTTNFVDGNQQDSAGYIQDVMSYVDELGGIGAGPGPAGASVGPATVGSIGSMSMIWGGADAPIAQELGSHDGEVYNNDPGIYDYAHDYLDSNGQPLDGHPGLDIALPIGTPVVAPIAGTVIYTGTAPNGQHYYADGAGGIGEIRLQAPNGDIIILGHMATSQVKAGDTITVGQPLGTTGQSDPRAESAHMHLEVRVLQPDGRYMIADPRTYFGGAQGGELAPSQNIGQAPTTNTIGAGGPPDPYGPATGPRKAPIDYSQPPLYPPYLTGA